MSCYNRVNQLINIYDGDVKECVNDIGIWVKKMSNGKPINLYNRFINLLFNFCCRCLKYNNIKMFDILLCDLIYRGKTITDDFSDAQLYILSKYISKYFYIYKDIKILQYFCAVDLLNKDNFKLMKKGIIVYLKNKKSKLYKAVQEKLVSRDEYWKNQYDEDEQYLKTVINNNVNTNITKKYDNFKNNIIKIIFKCIKYNDHRSLKNIFYHINIHLAPIKTLFKELQSLNCKMTFYKKIAKYAYIYKKNISEFIKVKNTICKKIFNFNEIIECNFYIIKYLKKRKSKLYLIIENDILTRFNKDQIILCEHNYECAYVLFLYNKYNRQIYYNNIVYRYDDSSANYERICDSKICDFKCGNLLLYRFCHIYLIINSLLIKKSYVVLFDYINCNCDLQYSILECIVYYSIIFNNIEILEKYTNILLTTNTLKCNFLTTLYDMFKRSLILNLYCTNNHLKLLHKIIDNIFYDDTVSLGYMFIISIEYHNKYENDIMVIYDMIYKKIIELNILNTMEYKNFVKNLDILHLLFPK